MYHQTEEYLTFQLAIITICLTKKKKKKIRASVSLWHGSLRELIHINIAAILESIALNLGRGSYANNLTNDYKTEDSYTDATMAYWLSTK